MHPCQRIHQLAAQRGQVPVYGQTPGICRITGSEGVGLPFEKWVKDTFTDHGYLKPGTIASNEALFTFDEASTLLQELTGREKVQRFRTYTHVVWGNQWHVYTKADKRELFRIITEESPEIVCLSESGQKHLLFKHRPGFWQLEELHVAPNIPRLVELHTHCCDLMRLGFSQTEIISGNYLGGRLLKCDLKEWSRLEALIKPSRGTAFFDFTTFLFFV